jgi:hypothetical protein
MGGGAILTATPDGDKFRAARSRDPMKLTPLLWLVLSAGCGGPSQPEAMPKVITVEPSGLGAYGVICAPSG